MAESSLSIKYADLQREIGMEVGYDRDSDNWTTQQTADVDHIIRQALRSVYRPAPIPGANLAHEWSFLRPVTTITTTAPYTTGTVTVASGVVTLVTGTWPSYVSEDATQAELVVGGSTYPVASYQSATQITLLDTSVTAAAGSSYTLRRVWYLLPDDFAGINGPITYDSDFTRYQGIEERSEADIRVARQNDNTANKPFYFAIVPKAEVESTVEGQRWRLTFHPIPDAAYILRYRYNRSPETINDSNPYPLGGEVLGEVILSACLWEANKRLDDGNKPTLKQEFVERLVAAVHHDRRQFTPDSLGTNSDPSTLQDTYDSHTGTGRRDFYYVKVNGVIPGK